VSNTRTCPECAARCKPQGPAKRLPSGFVDQVVVCPRCGWVGVVSSVRNGPIQLAMILGESNRDA